MALPRLLAAPGKLVGKGLDPDDYRQAAQTPQQVAPGGRAGLPGWGAPGETPTRIAPGGRSGVLQPPRREELNQNATRRATERQQEDQWSALMRGREGGMQTRELSDEEYNALNPNQRAAVDFNTAYMRAVQADRARVDSGEEPDSVTRQQYAELAREMFGEREGDAYTPNVVALLDSVGYRAPGANTDDLLEGLGGISQRELEFLGSPRMSRGQGLGVLSQVDLTDRQQQLAVLARGTQDVVDKLQQTTPGSSPTPLSLFAGTAFADRVGQYISQRGLGIGEDRVEVADTAQLNQLLDMNYSPPGENPIYYFAFQDTINKANPWTPEELFQLMQASGADPAGFPAYAEQQLRRYEQAIGSGANVTLGSDPSVQTYSPEEYRQLLGIQVG